MSLSLSKKQKLEDVQTQTGVDSHTAFSALNEANWDVATAVANLRQAESGDQA